MDSKAEVQGQKGNQSMQQYAKYSALGLTDQQQQLKCRALEQKRVDLSRQAKQIPLVHLSTFKYS